MHCATVKETVALMLIPRYVASSIAANAGARHRNLHDHVRGETAERLRLLDDGIAVAVAARIRLDRQPSVATVIGLEGGFEQPRGAHRQLLDESPSDRVLRGKRQLMDEVIEPRTPRGEVASDHRQRDHGVAGGPDRAVLDRVRELVDGGGVVPQARGGRLRHLMEWTPIADARCGGGHGDLSW